MIAAPLVMESHCASWKPGRLCESLRIRQLHDNGMAVSLRQTRVVLQQIWCRVKAGTSPNSNSVWVANTLQLQESLQFPASLHNHRINVLNLSDPKAVPPCGCNGSRPSSYNYCFASEQSLSQPSRAFKRVTGNFAASPQARVSHLQNKLWESSLQQFQCHDLGRARLHGPENVTEGAAADALCDFIGDP
jgi:hypothetical protein